MLNKVLIPYVVGARNFYPYGPNYYSDNSNLFLGGNSPWYESIYLYTDEQVLNYKTTKSLAGIKDVKTDKVIFDFDDKKNINLAFNDVKTLAIRLFESGIDKSAIKLFFSSRKGFHLELQFNDGYIERKKFEEIIYFFAGDLQTFDDKVKDEQRIIRVPFSFNPESKKYKIPFTYDEFVNQTDESLKELIEYCSDPDFNERLEVFNGFTKISLNTILQLIDIPNKKEKTKELLELPVITSDKPDMSRKPKHLTEAKYALQEGFFEEGERNEACMILAATYRYLGYNKELAYNMIKATLRLRGERLDLPDYDRSSLWKEVINPVYSPTWKGGTFSEDTGVLKKVIDRYGLNKINTFAHELISLDNVSDFFKDFAINIDKNTLKIGIEEVDRQVRITTGMLVTLLAAPSAGKSSIAMSILNTVSKNDCKCLFFSLDMSMQQTYQRLIQKHTGHQSDDIFEAYKTSNEEITSQYTSVLKDEYKNVKFSFRSGLTVDTIREMIITEQTITGIIPKLVVVDYLECIHGQFSDPTANKALIATQLKDIANQFNTCVLLLVQPRLAAGGPAGELNSYTDIKGSSVLGEASAVVLTLSRPGFNPKDRTLDRFATITVVKNRMGTLSSTDLSWEGITGNVGTLSDDGHRDLADLRAQLANQQESDEAYAGRTSGFAPFKAKPKGDMY